MTLEFIQWISAWLLIIVIAVAMTYLTPGRKILTYLVWLSIVIIIVTRSKQISSLFVTQSGQQILTVGQIGTS